MPKLCQSFVSCPFDSIPCSQNTSRFTACACSHRDRLENAPASLSLSAEAVIPFCCIQFGTFRLHCWLFYNVNLIFVLLLLFNEYGLVSTFSSNLSIFQFISVNRLSPFLNFLCQFVFIKFVCYDMLHPACVYLFLSCLSVCLSMCVYICYSVTFTKYSLKHKCPHISVYQHIHFVMYYSSSKYFTHTHLYFPCVSLYFVYLFNNEYFKFVQYFQGLVCGD